MTETKLQATQGEGGLLHRRGRFRVRFHDEEIDPPFDEIVGDERTFNALMAMADATKGPEGKKYLVLEKTGANILKAIVEMARLKNKNGGVGGASLLEKTLEQHMEKVDYYAEGKIPCPIP